MKCAGNAQESVVRWCPGSLFLCKDPFHKLCTQGCTTNLIAGGVSFFEVMGNLYQEMYLVWSPTPKELITVKKICSYLLVCFYELNDGCIAVSSLVSQLLKNLQ